MNNARLVCPIQNNLMSYNYSSSRVTYQTEYKPRQKDLPLDTVSSIVWDCYNNNDPTFLASSWDGFVRMYMVRRNNNEIDKVWEIFLQHPVLSVDMNENGIVFAGLASGDVVAVELSSGNTFPLGTHEAPICGVFWVREKGCLMTLGYDNLIRFWTLDPNNPLQKQYKLPLKTVTCSFDYPHLLIGSVQTTVSIVSLKNLPNLSIPNSQDDYFKINIERFSKFNCCRIISACNSISLGTIDGRVHISGFTESYSGIKIQDPYVTRVQKKIERSTTMYGQANAIDIGYHNYTPFVMIGGSDDLGIYNSCKKTKSKTVTTANSTVGATTAVRIGPKNEYIAYATGSDWLKGLYELQTMKRPKICVVKVSNSDLVDYTSK